MSIRYRIVGIRRASVMLGSLSPLIRQVLGIGAIGKTSASVSSPNSKTAIRVQGTLTFKGLQHVEMVDLSPRREMEVMCSIP